jgi:regulator of cell morphogenesis and NO signaling
MAVGIVWTTIFLLSLGPRAVAEEPDYSEDGADEEEAVPGEGSDETCPAGGCDAKKTPAEGDADNANPLLNSEIGVLVADDMRRAEFFEERGIDYYFKHKQSLEDAAEGIDVKASKLVLDLDAFDQKPEAPESVNNMTLITSSGIVAMLERKHVFMKSSLGTARRWAEGVVKMHGAEQTRRPVKKWVKEFQGKLEALEKELHPQLERKEKDLFPQIRKLDLAENADLELSEPETFIVDADAFLDGHGKLVKILRALRKLSNGYSVEKSETDTTIKQLLSKVKTLEMDLHKHMHAESAVLIPRVIRADARLQEKIKREAM